MLYTHLIRIIKLIIIIITARPRVLVLPYGTGNKVSRNDGLKSRIYGNFMPTLRGFRWYPYFVAQEQLVAFEASK